MLRSVFLACALLIAAGSAGAADQKIGSWTESTTKDPFDDSTQMAATDFAEGGALAIHCQTKPNRIVTATIVAKGFLGATTANDFFGSGSYRREVEYRFDDKPAQTSGWFYDDQTAFPIYPETRSFLLNVSNAHKLVVRLFDFRNNASTISFDLDGANAAIRPIYKECGQDF